jgi:hypothetical protein
MIEIEVHPLLATSLFYITGMFPDVFNVEHKPSSREPIYRGQKMLPLGPFPVNKVGTFAESP